MLQFSGVHRNHSPDNFPWTFHENNLGSPAILKNEALNLFWSNIMFDKCGFYTIWASGL